MFGLNLERAKMFWEGGVIYPGQRTSMWRVMTNTEVGSTARFSWVDGMPTDDDWIAAKPLGGEAVDSVGKLTTTWGTIKNKF